MHNIIIIDDDFDYRQLVCKFLKSIFTDTEVDEYDPISNGIPGKDFDWSKYDCAIVDYYLCIQNFTGLDLLKREQTNPQFPASIMLTGAGNEEIMAKSLKFGANRYISKQGLTKTVLRESIEQAWEKHQQNLRRRKLIDRRNLAFNKTRFYQTLETSSRMDYTETARAIISIEAIDSTDATAQQLDPITRNNLLKHVALISFRFLSIKHPEMCITTYTDTSLAIIIDYRQDEESIKTEIKSLQKEHLNNPWQNNNQNLQYLLVTSAVLISNNSVSNNEISEQIKLCCRKARSLPTPDKRILIHRAKPLAESSVDKTTPPETDVNDTSTEDAPVSKKATENPVEEPIKTSETNEVQKEGSQAEQTEAVSITAPEDEDKTGSPPEVVSAVEDQQTPSDKKTIVEADKVQAEDEKPADTKASEKKSTSKSSEYEIRLDQASLTEQDRKLIHALDERRIIQLFQPVMVFSTELFNVEEIYHVSLQMVDKDGDEETAQQIFSTQENPEVSKYIDRWMIKEAFSQIVDAGAENQNQMFMIKLSHHSLSDTTLFNWLRELLSGIDDFKPAESIALEISMQAYLSNQKQVSALIGFLAKTYGFHFIFGHIDKTADIKQTLDLPGKKLLMLKPDSMEELRTIPVEGDADENFVAHIKQKQIYLVARDIDDSTMLMNAINAGADFAIGAFVGEPQTQLDESSNIESYDLENRFGSTVF